MNNDYKSFIEGKTKLAATSGFEPCFMPEQAFGFQRELIEWSVRKGRAALFADCGMGKTLMQLAWAQNVATHTSGRVLILTPLAVSHQTVEEAGKFGIEASRSNYGELTSQIVVTNYERLHHFSADDFEGVVCDESSILKNYAGATRAAITAFAQGVKFRLLCTATAAPNDYMELGTSSEALGNMRYSEMLATYFNHDSGATAKWRLKRHAAKGEFWRWMCSWARAIRMPSDLGYCNDGFKLPPLNMINHVVDTHKPAEGMLFQMPAIGLAEQRDERRKTIDERCEMAAGLANHKDPVVMWCHLNAEGDALEKMVPDSVQVSGSDDDDAKEEKFRAFESGEARVMITKPKIAGFGLNWQHCARQTFFPSHSFEQMYQAIRRCWRFGQSSPVTVDMVTSPGEADVLANLMRKADQADALFANIVTHMGQHMAPNLIIDNKTTHTPSWL
jgi:hypothetical protein